MGRLHLMWCGFFHAVFIVIVGQCHLLIVLNSVQCCCCIVCEAWSLESFQRRTLPHYVALLFNQNLVKSLKVFSHCLSLVAPLDYVPDLFSIIIVVSLWWLLSDLLLFSSTITVLAPCFWDRLSKGRVIMTWFHGRWLCQCYLVALLLCKGLFLMYGIEIRPEIWHLLHFWLYSLAELIRDT